MTDTSAVPYSPLPMVTNAADISRAVGLPLLPWQLAYIARVAVADRPTRR